MCTICQVHIWRIVCTIERHPCRIVHCIETVTDFIFLNSKITADGDCSHEIKRRLLLGRKVMTNLDSILKSIDITLPTKVRLVIKAEIDGFLELSCFFDDPADVGNLISGSSAFSKTSLNIWSSQFMYC